MKQALLLLWSSLFIGCSHPKAFVLNDIEENKYFVSKAVNNAFEENQIDKCPLIVVNGIPFRYNRKEDTVILPFKKSDILSVEFLNKNSSRIIYNEKEHDGAVIITTRIQTSNP